MIRNDYLFCLIGISVCLVSATIAHEAITGSNYAKIDQFPYLVSLQENGHRKGHICGGGIIGDKFIITAAHCVTTNNGRFKGMPLLVVAGTSDISKTTEPTVILEVRKIYVSSEYSPPKSRFTDIAVLKLNYTLGLAKHRHLKMLKLPKNKYQKYDDIIAEFAGWGWHWIAGNETGGRNNDRLRYLVASTLSNSECQNNFSQRTIGEKQLCARVGQTHDHVRKRGVCFGDDGSPLVYNEILIGILSVIPDDCSELVTPGIYTRISLSLTFIDNALKGKSTRFMREYTL